MYIQISEDGNMFEISQKIRKIISKNKNRDMTFEIKQDNSENLKNSFLNLCIVLVVSLILISLFLFSTIGFNGLKFCLVQPLATIGIVFFVLFLLRMKLTIPLLSALFIQFGILISLNFLDYSYPIHKSDAESGKSNSTYYGIFLLPAYFPFLIEKNIPDSLSNETTLSNLLLYGIHFCFIKFLPIRISQDQNHKTSFTFLYFIELINCKLEKILSKTEKLILKKSKFSLILFSTIIIFGSYSYMFSVNSGEFKSPKSENILEGKIEFPSGTNFTEMNRISKIAEKILFDFPEISEVHSRIRGENSHLFLKLKDFPKNPEIFYNEIEAKTKDLYPVFIHFLNNKSNFAGMEILADFYGENPDELDKLIKNFCSEARKFPGIHKVFFRYKPPRQELKIQIDRTKTDRSNLNSKIIGEELKLSILGGVATKLVENGKEIDIKIRLDRNDRKEPEDLNAIKILSLKNGSIPLKEISIFEPGLSPSKIYRKNRRRNLSVSFLISPNAYNETIAELEKLKEKFVTENIHIEISRSDDEKNSGGDVNFHLRIFFSEMLFFMVLFSYFESFAKSAKVFLATGLSLALLMSFFYFSGHWLITPDIRILFLINSIFGIFILQIENKLKIHVPGNLKSSLIFYGDFVYSLFLKLFLVLSIFFFPAVILQSEGLIDAHNDSINILAGLFIAYSLFPLLRTVLITLTTRQQSCAE